MSSNPPFRYPGQSGTVTIPKRVELATRFGTRDSTFGKAERIINGYVEQDPETQEYWIYRRPSLVRSWTPPAPAAGKGVCFWYTFPGIGAMISIVGNNVYSHNLSTLSETLIGTTVVGPSDINYFTVVPGSPALLVFGDGITAYKTDGATVTQLLNANGFPTAFYRGWAYLNSRLYVFEPFRQVKGATSLDNPTNWDPLNVIQAADEPDFGVALAKHMNYVVTMKEWTTQFFYDAGNPVGSTLSRLEGTTLPFGCLNDGSVNQLDGILFWISSNRTSAPQVMMLERQKPTVISTPPIERLLKAASSDTFYSLTFKLGGHRFYVISALSSDWTLVYDVDQLFWYQWTSPTGGRWPLTSGTYLPIGSGIVPWRHIVQGDTGSLYTLAEGYEVATDDGVRVPVDIYTKAQDFGTKFPKTLNGMYFASDRHQGKLQVRWNDSDFDPLGWSDFRDVDLSVDVPNLKDCGTFTRRSWNLRYEDATALRLKTVDLQLDIGTGV